MPNGSEVALELLHVAAGMYVLFTECQRHRKEFAFSIFRTDKTNYRFTENCFRAAEVSRAVHRRIAQVSGHSLSNR